MDAAFSYLTAKPRTVREMERYLDSKQYGEYEVYQAVERLKELNYLDDEKYAADFIASRLATRPASRRKLREQLYSHQLNKDVIENALLAVTDAVEEENARIVSEKFYRQFMGLEERERRERTIKRLVARGYGYDTVRSAMQRVAGECDEFDISAMEAETDGDDED